MAKLSKRAKGAYFVVVAILICSTHIYFFIGRSVHSFLTIVGLWSKCCCYKFSQRLYVFIEIRDKGGCLHFPGNFQLAEPCLRDQRAQPNC